MRLHDRFRPPVENKHSWDELHGMWPAVIVQQRSLDVDLGVSLDLETSDEETCHMLGIE